MLLMSYGLLDYAWLLMVTSAGLQVELVKSGEVGYVICR